MDINQKLTEELDVNRWQIDAAVNLIDEGNTIPFISRYRKEVTGSLNDEQLRKLHERLLYLRNLEEKKEQVISSIEEQGKMTEELKEKILAAETLVTVEDLYRPYRPKRRTRATIAKEKGLEPLAAYLMLQQAKEPLEETAKQYLSEEKEVKTAEEAIAGAKDIIAEIISDNADYRTWIRKATMNDLPNILAIYAYARKYMKEHGNSDQWRDSYPPVSLTTQDIQSDCLYVCIIQIEEDEQIGHKRKRRGAHAGCARCHSAQVQARRDRLRRRSPL